MNILENFKHNKIMGRNKNAQNVFKHMTIFGAEERWETAVSNSTGCKYNVRGERNNRLMMSQQQAT